MRFSKRSELSDKDLSAMTVWAILKMIAISLTVALVLEAAIGIIFFKVRDLRSVITILIMQYVTATLSAILVLYFTPIYIQANPSMPWLIYAAIALMLAFSIMVESLVYGMREVTDKPMSFAIVSNIVSFAACGGLTLIGALPAIF